MKTHEINTEDERGFDFILIGIITLYWLAPFLEVILGINAKEH